MFSGDGILRGRFGGQLVVRAYDAVETNPQGARELGYKRVAEGQHVSATHEAPGLEHNRFDSYLWAYGYGGSG